MVHGLFRKTVERVKARHDWRQSRWNHRVGGVGPARFALHVVLVNFRAQRLAHESGVAGKLNDGPARGHPLHFKTLGGEPICHGLEVGIGRAELPAKFFGSEPVMKIPRALGLLLVEQVPQAGFLLRTALQDQQDALHGHAVGRGSPVVFRPRQRVSIPS